MKPEIKAQWVAALRSGEYMQGKTFLKKVWGNGVTNHCCLGVLAELHKKATGHEQLLVDRSGLNSKELHWSGLTEELGNQVTINGYTHYLSGQNDRNPRTSFLQIADAIEAQL